MSQYPTKKAGKTISHFFFYCLMKINGPQTSQATQFIWSNFKIWTNIRSQVIFPGMKRPSMYSDCSKSYWEVNQNDPFSHKQINWTLFHDSDKSSSTTFGIQIEISESIAVDTRGKHKCIRVLTEQHIPHVEPGFVVPHDSTPMGTNFQRQSLLTIKMTNHPREELSEILMRAGDLLSIKQFFPLYAFK